MVRYSIYFRLLRGFLDRLRGYVQYLYPAKLTGLSDSLRGYVKYLFPDSLTVSLSGFVIRVRFQGWQVFLVTSEDGSLWQACCQIFLTGFASLSVQTSLSEGSLWQEFMTSLSYRFRSLWQALLTYTGLCWHIQGFADIYRALLTYTGLCWQVLLIGFASMSLWLASWLISLERFADTSPSHDSPTGHFLTGIANMLIE